MRVSLDYHDLSFQNNQLFWINKLREQFPNIKLSMFFVPADMQFVNKFRPDEEAVVKDRIKKAVEEGWMELIPHGLTHVPREFEKADYQTMSLTLKAYEEFFGKWGVPYVKGFCAPQWLISDEAIKCLDDNGWWMAVDKNQPDSPRTKKFYEYNWDIAFPPPKDQELIKGHGHISEPSINNLPACIKNLVKIPADAQFVFVSELMK